MEFIFEDRENIPILDTATVYFNRNVLPVLEKEFHEHENNAEILFHSVKAGKRLRPLYCYLAYKLAGGSDDASAHHAAAAMELIHCSSLLIDDELDAKNERPDRELATVRSRFTPQEAVFTGACLELLYSYNLLIKSGEGLHNGRKNKVLRAFAGTYSEALTKELEKWRHIENKDIMTKEEYMKYTSSSSGFFFEMCGKIGSLLATEDQKQVSELSKIGHDLGLILGLGDDVKDLKEDMEQGYYSLSVINYLEKLEGTQRENLRKKLHIGLTNTDVEEIYEKLVETGSIEYCLEEMRRKMELIKERVKTLPDGENKNHVDELADFLSSRMKLKKGG
jgi:geranylgeranyl diphosphate synthase type I